MLKRAIVLSCLAAVSVGLYAADAPKKPAEKYSKEEADKQTYLDPAKASPDFAVQGEYVGEAASAGAAKKAVAAQISAQGGGKFLAAFYDGGLPGASWDGKSRHEATGTAKDATMTEVTFAPEP